MSGDKMIIGYYEQVFFGGGTYYKLSKKIEEINYKIEYSHSAVPNYIPDAEEYIKKYETLEITDKYNKEDFEGKIKVDYISECRDIEKLERYINKCDWNKISKKKYSDEEVNDGICWNFYIEFENQKYEIKGYEIMPKEISTARDILKSISNQYLDEIVPNKRYIERMNANKNNNIYFRNFLYNKSVASKKKFIEFIKRYK